MDSNTCIGFRIVCFGRLDTRLYSISGIASTAYGRPQAKIASSSYIITQVHFSIFSCGIYWKKCLLLVAKGYIPLTPFWIKYIMCCIGKFLPTTIYFIGLKCFLYCKFNHESFGYKIANSILVYDVITLRWTSFILLWIFIIFVSHMVSGIYRLPCIKHSNKKFWNNHYIT